MRLDTFAFRRHLIEALEARETGACIEVDEMDVLRVRLRSSERVEIHLIERDVEVDEIRAIFQQNQRAEVPLHTLYLLWTDMTLPESGQVFEPDAWVLLLHYLFNERVYTYKVYGDQSYIYPVHLEAINARQRRVHYGEPIQISGLGCAFTRIFAGALAGDWRVADFGEAPLSARYQRTRRADSFAARHIHTDLLPYFELLQLAHDADHALLKKAYRQLARQFHPDVNNTPEATLTMQRVNEAYQKILAWLDEEARSA
ncbi:MAG: J domain-containing protein [Anaerolineae bacterium]|nr:J domain-containing protein [Anaerolineae bacterium]